MPVIVLLVLSAIFAAAGDGLGKYWSLHPNWRLFALSLLVYLIGAAIYMSTLLREGLAETAIVWTILSATGFLLIAFFVFHESLAPLQYAGIALGVVSILLLQFGK